MATPESATGWSGAEQAPIGRQLHDVVVPQLFVLTTGLTALRRRAGSEDDALIRDLVHTAMHTLSDLRAISRGQVMGVGGDLRQIGRRFRRETRAVAHLTDCEIVFDVAGDATVCAPLADDLVAFVWEAIANAIRHGAARRVEISLSVEHDTLVLSATDDGTWRPPVDGAGTGINGLEGRAARWGGTVIIGGSISGTRLVWCSPLGSVDERADGR